MQESLIEAAVYQEAVLKLSHHMIIRPDGFYRTDNIWDIYAEKYAPDATPQEVETFVESFPDISKDQETPYRFPAAHALQFYGAVALRATADNPSLQKHSTQKLSDAANNLQKKGSYISLQLAEYAIDGLSACGKTAEAIEATKVLSQRGGNYDPENYIALLSLVAESFEKHGISAATHEEDYWQLTETALDVYDKAQEHAGKHRRAKPVDRILCCTIAELYRHTDRQAVRTFCEAHTLYPELMIAVHASGESISDQLLDKAISAGAKRESLDTTRALARVCIEQGDEPHARKIVKSLPGYLRKSLRERLEQDIIAHIVQDGDFAQAVARINKIKNTHDAMNAINTLNEALIAHGDIDKFIEINSKISSRFAQETTFSGYTARMAVSAGDTGRALELIQADPNAPESGSWYKLAYDYIDQHIRTGTPESISIDVVCNFLETSRHNDETDMSFVYAMAFKHLYEAGCVELAQELASRFHGSPEHVKSFSRHLQPMAIRSVIDSGNWLEAMHGSHLEDPEAGLILSRHIILIAGGIHRERTRRKQTQAIEGSSNNLL